MIKNRDLAIDPLEVARAMPGNDRAEVFEDVARELSARSLDRVQRVVLRLMALGSVLDPATREALLIEADELDAAVVAAREVLFPRSGSPGSGSGPARLPASDASGSAVEVALLDTAGVIVWVNEAWEDFCSANGGDPGRAGVGRSYLDLCDAVADEASADIARTIRLALQGDLPAPARIPVPRPAPDVARTVDVLVSSRLDDGGGVFGVMVTLSEARLREPGDDRAGLAYSSR